MHFDDFGDPFLFHFALKTAARVGLVCENCDDVVNASNEIIRIPHFLSEENSSLQTHKVILMFTRVLLCAVQTFLLRTRS